MKGEGEECRCVGQRNDEPRRMHHTQPHVRSTQSPLAIVPEGGECEENRRMCGESMTEQRGRRGLGAVYMWGRGILALPCFIYALPSQKLP